MARIAKPNELHLTRIYDAPPKTVWDAWVDPDQAAKWWGPRGFTLTTHSKDLRVGGTWVYTMHAPDGVDFPNLSTYHEIVPLRRLVYDHGASADRPPMFRVTVDFEDLGGKTRMEMTMALPTEEAARNTRAFVKKAGGEATWDRLAEHLEETGSGRIRFVINRSFDAPRAIVYDMWTKAEHFSKWLPPTGFTMEFIEADIRPGGATFYKMAGTGMTMYGRTHYIEMTPPDRLVYTQQFADENGKISRHPMAPTWPETMLSTVSFEEEGPERTRVTVCWEPHGPATAEEIEVFAKARGGMTVGWTGSFDKLDEVLATKG